MNQIPHLSESEYSTLMNAMSVAARQFTQNATQLREAAPLYKKAEEVGQKPLVTERGALMLADQFDRQAEQTFDLIDKIREYEDAQI